MVNMKALSTRLSACGSIKRYTPRDLETIVWWYQKRGIEFTNTGSLSDMGFIADDRVAGWLYLTNSNMAIIEGIISDPDTIPSYRRESLTKLCTFLVDTALMLGYTQVVGITSHPSIDKVCKQLGFSLKPGYNVWTLSESEEDENSVNYRDEDIY